MMRVLAYAALLGALAPGAALGQSSEWSADQDGMNFICYDVGSLQINDLAGSGTRCVQVDSAGNLIASSTACGSPLTAGTGITFVGGSSVTSNLSTGVPGGQSVIGGTGTTDSLTVQATNATPASGAKIYLQTKFGNDYFDPVVHTLGLGGGANPISMFASGAQLIAKSGGELDIGTVDGHGVSFETNGLTALALDSGQHVVVPLLGGVGNQCIEADNTGQLFGIGAACGTSGGGTGTVTSVTGTAPISCSPSSPNPVCSLALAADMSVVAGDLTQADFPLVSRATNAPSGAANLGALIPNGDLISCAISSGVCTPTPVAPSTFQPAGNYITALTNDVTATGPGSVAATIGANKVTYPKIQQVGTGALLGNPTGSLANVSEVTLGNGLGYTFPAPGVQQLQNTSPLFALSAVTPLAFDSATNTLTAPGVLYTGGTPPVDLGIAVANSIVACSTSGSVCSPTGVVVAGGLHYASGTLTDAAFSCPSSQWVSSTSTSGPTCTQPSISNLQSIGAHTIVANGTALAAAPAQTSIGTTLAFDGTGQLQCVGLRDGGGVNHVTTGTWPISSVIETDVSGNIAAEAQLACGQSEGPWTGVVSKLAGSCATGWQSIWPPSGDALLSSGPAATPTGVALTANTVLGSAGAGATALTVQGGLGTFIGNVLSGVNFGASGAAHAIGMVPDPGSTAGTSRVLHENATWAAPGVSAQLSYSMRLSLLLNAGEVIQGGLANNPDGAIGTVRVEYPIGMAAAAVTLSCFMTSNNITGGTYAVRAAQNGVIVGSALLYTSGSTANHVSTTSTAVSGSTTTDTWGLNFSSVGTANTPCGGGVCTNGDLYCTILLTP